MTRPEPHTPLGRVAKEAARFGPDAYDLYIPRMEWEGEDWEEHGFSMEIQDEAPYIMWDHIASKVIDAYTASLHDPNP